MASKPTLKKKLWVAILLVFGVIGGGVAGALIGLTHDLPQIRELASYQPSATTRIFSSDRVLLAELYAERRHPVTLDAIPNHLKAALIATEDRSFYKHSGVDLKGILRAVIKDIRAGEFVEGASTITQQLAKTLFLTPRKSLLRKIKEALLAFQLERRYTKNEILELYLNQVYFGSGAYGVDAAARIFFGKTVQTLSLAECALVAGMPKAPSRLSPLIDKEKARARRDVVLMQMRATDIITAAQYQAAREEALVTADQRPDLQKAPFFIDYIKTTLEKDLGAAMLYKGGLTVHTTLVSQLQDAALQAVRHGTAKLAARMARGGLPSPNPEGALVAVEIASGAIVAMVGGKDYHQNQYNRATMARRPPGSAFKPFVYALAIERGATQSSLLLDAPVVFKGSQEGVDWQPENFSKTYMGELSFRKALALSKNIPAVRLIEGLGSAAVARFADQMGIDSALEPNLSLALGTSGVNLLELTAAYAVFPNRGQWNRPYGVVQVQDRQGRSVWRPKPEKRQPLGRTSAAIMTDMLAGVIHEGTGRRARVLNRPVGGKTGTTDHYRDALFIGFSPSISAGVWVGQDQYVTLGDRETGAKAALPIWIDFMRIALADSPLEYFDLPDDVVRVRINPDTGALADSTSDGTVTALFKQGTTPPP